MLVRRLALVALVVCIIFAVIAYVSERNRVQNVIVDLSRIQVQRFNKRALPVFDNAAGIDKNALQSELN